MENDKNPKPRVKEKFTEERYQQHIEAHCKLLEAIHRYFIEFEEWEQSRSFNSSRRLFFWLMRMQKQLKIRLVQIKSFQDNRDTTRDREVYRKAYREWKNIETKIIEDSVKADIKSAHEELGVQPKRHVNNSPWAKKK
jgi:hypothetical protein